MANTDKKGILIVYFDGYCGLCNGFVDFLLRIDRKDKLRFSPLQQGESQKFLNGKIPPDTDSIIVETADGLLIKSEAVLFIFSHLGAVWKIFLIGRILPLSWRDYIYDQIARRRYNIFGKRSTCRLPSPQEKSKFL